MKIVRAREDFHIMTGLPGIRYTFALLSLFVFTVKAEEGPFFHRAHDQLRKTKAEEGPYHRNADPIGPMKKVLELLDVMSKELDLDAVEDGKGYEADTKYYDREKYNSTAVLKQTRDTMAQLEFDLQEAEAFREGKSKDLIHAADHLAKNNMELDKTRDVRKEDREVFERNEAVYVEAIDQLTRALEVMDKTPPVQGSNAAASSSLLTIALQLKKTLSHASDLSLSALQSETLKSFVRTASTLSESSRATSFLQYGARKDTLEVYDHYGGGSGGLIAALKTVLGHVHQERDGELKVEVENKKRYTEWRTSMESLIANTKKSISDMRMTIAQSQQQSSQYEASLLQAKEVFKTETEHLATVESDYRRRTQEYKTRLRTRTDEAIALHQAQRILASEVAKSYMDTGKFQGISFVQVSQQKIEVRRKALHVFSTAPTPALALLALKSTVHYKIGTQADPFAKMKVMIKELLERLYDEQAKETRHAAWCEQEMAKTTKSQGRKEDDIQKTKDRLEALQAGLMETTQDINTTSKDLELVNASIAEATLVRAKEHKSAMDAVKMYKYGVALLSNAIKVLKSFYGRKDRVRSEGLSVKGPKVDDRGMRIRQGLSTGVIGMLDVALHDFKTSLQEALAAEKAAALDFQQFRSESNIRIAVFNKDLEYKSRNKVKLEFDESTMKNDLKSYKQELSAVNSYMSKLKVSCTLGITYQERKAKRQDKLKSLKDCLSILLSENAVR